METFMFAVNAVGPIILLIFFGYYLKKKKFLEEDWFRKGNKLVFKVCLPVLLFINVYNIESLTDIKWSVVIYAEIAIFVVFLLGLLLVKIAIPNDKQKGVILQCVFRSNFAIIGLPLAESLGGAEGVGVAALLSAFSIPTFNILAVIALSMYNKNENGQKVSVGSMVKKVVTNPLIIGVVCGLIVLAIRSFIPTGEDGMPVFTLKENVPFLFNAVNNIAKICSPLALIILGGLFDFSAVKELRKQIVIGTVARVVGTPLLAIGGAVLVSRFIPFFEMSSAAYPALVALFGSPVAVSSAIMAQEMDNDGVLAGQLVVWTSIASIFTIFLAVVLLRGIGLL